MGDKAILGSSGVGYGSMHVENIDANSKQTEQYTEERVVDGKTLFLSPESAQQLDAASDRSWTVHDSGTTLQRLKRAFDEWRAGK